MTDGQQLAAGWYPDPDDPTARRYWDGQAWSAPLPVEVTPAAPSPSAQKSSWQARAEDRETAVTPPCSVGPCQAARVPGTLYCGQHGPRQTRSRPTAATSTALVCPHCQVRGRVSSKQVKMKKGVSGGKLTGAVLTAGISILGTGLSRKEKVTEMRCGNCKTVWHV